MSSVKCDMSNYHPDMCQTQRQRHILITRTNTSCINLTLSLSVNYPLCQSMIVVVVVLLWIGIGFILLYIDCQLNLNVQKENLYCSRKSFLIELYCIWRLCCSADRQGGVGDGPPGTSTTIPASHQFPDQCGRQPAWAHIMGQQETTFHGPCHFSCFSLHGFYLDHSLTMHSRLRFMFI